MPKKIMCCLCLKSCECEYGHNPYPIIDTIDSLNAHLRCCGKCNDYKVVPTRIKIILDCIPNMIKDGNRHRVCIDGSRDMEIMNPA